MPDTLQTNLGNFNKKQVSHPRDDPSDCGSTKDGSLLITAGNSCCGKVMFSQACVIPSVQWGRGCLPLGLGMGVCLWVWGVYAPGHILWKHNTPGHPPHRHNDQQADGPHPTGILLAD